MPEVEAHVAVVRPGREVDEISLAIERLEVKASGVVRESMLPTRAPASTTTTTTPVTAIAAKRLDVAILISNA